MTDISPTPSAFGDKQQVALGPVQETLLIPLYGRALETRRRGGLLHDQRALDIIERLDYDFTKWSKTNSPIGACLRTLMVDEDVQEFLTANPTGTVVEIGCGLNTRYERIDNGKATWIELDLPDSMALRRRFFSETRRRRMLAASALDTEWMVAVAATGGPWCFVSEAVLIYLDAPQVETVVRNLAASFPGAWLVMDTASMQMRDSQQKHDVMKTLPQASWFRWACDNPASITNWGAQLVRSRDFLDASLELKKRFPFGLRLLATLFPSVLRKKMQGYKLNRYLLAAPLRTQQPRESR
jgi:O-methyltransferase involved in polyketide biosynthesis